jgi:transglutaminase-like putative cysteine protease
MKVLRSYRVLRFALVLSAICAQCIALGNLALLVVAGTLASLSLVITEGPRAKFVPPWVARLLVLAVFLYSLFDVIGPVDQLPLVLGQFVVWLTIIKLYGKRTIEHEAQLLLLSVLLMTVGALYATGFLFGLLLIAWSGFGLLVLLLYQLRHGMETCQEERRLVIPVKKQQWSLQPIVGFRPSRAFRNNAVIFLLLGLIGSTALFIVTPRETLEVLPDAMIARDSGLERIALRPDRNILQSTRQVMTVSLQDIFGNTVHMPDGLRLRGKVLDAYLGNGVWEAHMQMKSTIISSATKMTPLTLTQTNRPTLLMVVEMQQPVARVYSLYRPVAIKTDPPSRIAIDLVNATMGLGIGSTPLRKYQVEIDYEKEVTSPFKTKRYSYSNENVHALALQLLADAGVDVEEIPSNPAANAQAAKALELYLRSDAFTYTTDGSTLTIAERAALELDDDPVATFLLTYKSGHCEFFATAMVAMCDTISLPARIVTGFYVDRWDDMTNKYIVLERDAHAWVEVETDPMAWVTFDPTPASLGSPTQQQSMTIIERMVYAWQQWEMAWTTNVIGYDALAQDKLLEYTTPYWREYGSAFINRLQLSYAWTMGVLGIGKSEKLWAKLIIGLLILVCFAVVLVRYRLRKIATTLSLSSAMQEHVPLASVLFYARLQRALARQGLIRPLFLPAKAWVSSLPLDKDSAELAISLTETYYKIRFGSYKPNRSERSELVQSATRFERLLQKGDV